LNGPRKPDWLKKRLPPLHEVEKVRTILRAGCLHTVCEEARCPNLGECFARGTATFLILGRICSRSCGFCGVESGTLEALDEAEPSRVARAASEMGLRYVVVTSVTRDDLPDGGAGHYAKTIRALRQANPEIRIEVLIPDFRGDLSALNLVLSEGPDVLNHNVETVPRLYSRVRPQARYDRSLELLSRARTLAPGRLVKSGFMLGLGEREEEVLTLLDDLAAAGVDLVTIGQYLQPRPDRVPVERFVPPGEFEEYERRGLGKGLRAVAAGPFVRSSFNASLLFEKASR
jgi:lipoic acid synthetase